MAFLGSLSKPIQYNPNANRNNTGFQRTTDRLITIESYDTARGLIVGVDKKGKKYEAHVESQIVIDRNNFYKNNPDIAKNAPWMGHRIDDSMEKNYPVGSKVILVRTKFVQMDRVRGIIILEIERVAGVTNPEEDKTFEGIMTLTARSFDGEVSVDRIQVWEERGIDVGDSDKISELANAMDESSESYGQVIGKYNVTTPKIGIQFRALQKTDREYQYGEEGKKEIYEVVNTSIPFDWVPGPLDENGKEIREQAHVINGDEMIDLVSGYVEYIQAHEDYKDKVDDMRVEVCVYRNYQASHNKQFTIAGPQVLENPERFEQVKRSPFYQLTHKESYVDQSKTVKLIGKNMAVLGIIQVSANKIDKINGVLTEVPMYWASNLFTNNYRGHVHSFVRTSDGYKTEPCEEMRLINENEVVAEDSVVESKKGSEYVAKNQTPAVDENLESQKKVSVVSESQNETVEGMGSQEDLGLFGMTLPEDFFPNSPDGGLDSDSSSVLDLFGAVETDDFFPTSNESEEVNTEKEGQEETAVDTSEDVEKTKVNRANRIPNFKTRTKE